MKTRLALALATLIVLTQTLLGAGPASASSDVLIEGSGSSWAAIAVNQWVSDVQTKGVPVSYSDNGDAQGRQDYANKVADFAVTALGYQGVDPVTGIPDTSEGRPYAYLPIAAGGTAFPYQLKFHGKQVTTLRLSGQTLAEIFTNKITNWDDSQITKDNNGVALPSLPITPVVQSEGSGATAQLTTYFATEYPSIWKSFSKGVGETEYFPRAGNQIAQNGSNGAMNYVSSSAANGSIGYVEYSYAISQGYPVVKLLNADGYFTLPTQYNVAVALTKAQINMDQSSPNYLLQTLNDVYTDSDPRTYPLSSYVYMIIPTGAYPSPETQVTNAKRQTIADFTYYDICQGQKEIGPIGYSSLPVNLVEAGFGQLNKMKVADPSLNLAGENVTTCNNPTFVAGHPDANYLAQIAPQPPACDKVGAGPCAAGVTPDGTGKTPTSSKGGSSGGSGTIKPGTGASTASTGTPVGTITGANGQVVSNGGGAEQSDGSGSGSDLVAGSPDVSASLAGYRASSLSVMFAVITGLLLLLALIAPPLVAHQLSRRRTAAPRRDGEPPRAA